MSTTSAPTAADLSSEAYLPIEEVAERLDLPLGVLIRRVEAGDVPARRTEGPQGAQYSVRVSDLGFGAEDAMAKRKDTDGDKSDAATQGVELVGSARPTSWPDKVVPAPKEELAAVSSHAPGTEAGRAPAAGALADKVPAATPVNGSVERAAAAPAARALTQRDVGVISTPRAEVANMALDPRELVAGLLDRWERTLEQRIYSEQRQRFETELNARQNLLKQLQLELQTARAEHAAAQADKDRVLADRDRQVADLQRELTTSRETSSRRRGWFSRG
jgi:hypothetical protein